MSDWRLSRRSFLRRASLGAATIGAGGAPHLLRQPKQRTPQTLHDKVAQLFVISFAGTTPSAATLSLLQRYTFGGVILYARNCGTASQVRSLIATLQAASRYPLLVCVDQEGGSVVRVRQGVSVFPSEATYGAMGSASRVYADATATAVALHKLGFTMNVAPVVDVLSNRKSPIGTRSYGSNALLVSQLSVAAIQGYQQHGLAATAKHFIGLGHTSVDSHQALPTVTQTWQQLAARDGIPFRAAIRAGVSSILAAHVALPRIDPVHRPASLSPVIMKGLIRRTLGFTGVVMTDSLVMGAVPRGQEVDAPRQALIAGADMLLLGTNLNLPAGLITNSIERIVSGVRVGHIPESTVDAALTRVLALKQRYPPLTGVIH